MARPWRIQSPGTVYHVMARGNNQRIIFIDDLDPGKFLQLLDDAGSRYELGIFSFCLMTNHYHLFVRTAKAGLASALQWLNGMYTNHFNRRHHRAGHLLPGRYRAQLVTDFPHWLHLSMYIHLNPVRARMVNDPKDYPWSSYFETGAN